ncbi:hypothetical protein AMS68_005566 [Peltaster fructicola]|uniref:non-specific serine/threonine protein kinase n=1 Tax=Peltaster fructicola TaxID=286661 RepID=A0A6H0XZK7_9PEZI|nr:hypothetical protein AMS68_005566 [Peltaster fructicola]
MASAPRSNSSSKRPSASALPDNQPDEIIGDFRRGKEIGKGSFASVYLAQHRKKKSYAAVKVVQTSKLTKKLKENLESEISILKSIQHPHIVALFACSEGPGYIYLVMEYCQLSDLSQFMKKRVQLSTLPETADIFRKYPNLENGGLNEVLSRHFVKQVASALEYLRHRNLIHRDIKPQNLLLNPSPAFMARQRPEDIPLTASDCSLIPAVGVNTLPMIKVADFGFAKHLPSTAMAETLCGSPLYMAPEILRYEKYDARADLWSTGTVLYEMVVGKPPFRAQNHVDLLRRIEKAGDIISFDRHLPVSREMKNTIRSLLKKDPVERVSYERFFQDPLITGPIPGLVGEDKPVSVAAIPQPEVSELARGLQKQPVEDTATPTLDEGRASRKSSDQDLARREQAPPRRSSENPTTEMRRQPSQREQRRPSIVAHPTAPARQELHTAAPRIERRASRSSPLAGPPMVREQSMNEARATDNRTRSSRDKSAQDVADERDYVLIDGNQVKVNAIADEFEANTTMYGRSAPAAAGAMARRATVQGHVNSLTGAEPSSPSRGMQIVSGRYPHQRNPSFDRRLGASPQSATNMLTKALNAANARLFGALGTSPPMPPPIGYAPFPTYTAPQLAIGFGDTQDTKGPVDEDVKIVRIMEEAAHRSDVIYGFAEVKFRQLLPATPSAQDGLGIQQLGDPERVLRSSEVDDDKDMTVIAIVGVAEEALVLYVKTLAILAKTIDLAGFWWTKHSRNEGAAAAVPRTNTTNTTDVNKRINNVVQWARNRFNECLEKSEVVGRRLIDAQKCLPEDHPAHPNNHTTSSGSAGAISASTGDQIQITTGVTAERLMFERAVEMSRAAAVNELVGEELQDCELGYKTAIMLFEAVLEADDEPLMRKPSAKKDKAGDEPVKGVEGEERQAVVKLIEGTRARLGILRKKLAHALQDKTANPLARRIERASSQAGRPSSNPS